MLLENDHKTTPALCNTLRSLGRDNKEQTLETITIRVGLAGTDSAWIEKYSLGNVGGDAEHAKSKMWKE